MITGPELMERSGLDRLDLVKIDVEGHEEPVLRSLQPILARWRPRAVVFEHDGNPDEPGSAVGSVFRAWTIACSVSASGSRATSSCRSSRSARQARRFTTTRRSPRAHGRAVSRPRVLLIAEVADPEGASVPLVGWSHARAIARVTDAHLVTQIRSRDAILRAGLREGLEFSVIDSERIARPAWKFIDYVRGGSDKGWTTATAVSVLTNWYFERLVWKRLGRRSARASSTSFTV